MGRDSEEDLPIQTEKTGRNNLDPFFLFNEEFLDFRLTVFLVEIGQWLQRTSRLT